MSKKPNKKITEFDEIDVALYEGEAPDGAIKSSLIWLTRCLVWLFWWTLVVFIAFGCAVGILPVIATQIVLSVGLGEGVAWYTWVCMGLFPLGFMAAALFAALIKFTRFGCTKVGQFNERHLMRFPRSKGKKAQ